MRRASSRSAPTFPKAPSTSRWLRRTRTRRSPSRSRRLRTTTICSRAPASTHRVRTTPRRSSRSRRRRSAPAKVASTTIEDAPLGLHRHHRRRPRHPRCARARPALAVEARCHARGRRERTPRGRGSPRSLERRRVRQEQHAVQKRAHEESLAAADAAKRAASSRPPSAEGLRRSVRSVVATTKPRWRSVRPTARASSPHHALRVGAPYPAPAAIAMASGQQEARENLSDVRRPLRRRHRARVLREGRHCARAAQLTYRSSSASGGRAPTCQPRRNVRIVPTRALIRASKSAG